MNSSASNHLTSSASASGNNAPAPGLKTYFKTPEGKYKLQFEKTYPVGLIHQAQSKTVTQVTLAHLKDKPAQARSQSSTGSGGTSSVRSAAARFWGGGNSSRALSFGVGNGGAKPVVTGCTRIGSFGSSSSYNAVANPNFDGKGTYLVFNVNDSIFLSDLNSQDKDPIKSIHFSNSNPVCHAYDPDAKDGHDLLIGLNSGDVYSVSLRQQLQDVGKKLVGAQHYNKDGSINNSRCTCVVWIPNGDGSFVAAHADGNMYVYEKNKDITSDPSFPTIKDQIQFSVSHARNSKNPVVRWHICEGSINGIGFSPDGAYIATIGRDGFLRVFDYKNEQLIFEGKSYYGALLCCAWRGLIDFVVKLCFQECKNMELTIGSENSDDGKYILTGGEDDLIQVWSLEDRKVVAWGEGHNSWVSGVAFDSYWVAPSSDGVGEDMVYRFGSVGQDTQLLLWDFQMDELIVPARRPPGGSPTFSAGSQSSHWDSACPVGRLHPAPSIRDIPKLAPLVAHRVHTEPLSGVIFTQESVLTASREGHIKIWARPASSESQLSNLDSTISTNAKEKPRFCKVDVSSFQQ